MNAGEWTPNNSVEWSRDVCRHHAPDEEAIERISRIRDAATMFVAAIIENCPACEDRGKAVDAARMAMMWANASIALEGKI